jgi:hypothetical protein
MGASTVQFSLFELCNESAKSSVCDKINPSRAKFVMVMYFNVHCCNFLSNICIIIVPILSTKHEKPNDV